MEVDRSKRKLEHIQHAIQIGHTKDASFYDIRFIHQSLPEISLSDVSLTTSIGELKLSSPIFINAMTGGGGVNTERINRQLAEVASIMKIPMAVGSQMAAIKDEAEANTYKVVRKINETGIIFANIGSEATVDQAIRCVEMIEADGLQVHLNVIQELVMPEGDRDFSSTLKRIEQICKAVHVPVIVKEVGFGMNRETVQKLIDVGVSIIDVGGFGGTNFSRIENMRRTNQHLFFNDWGIPTTISLCEAVNSSNVPIIASGGIQDAADVAKAIALGASGVGLAGIILRWLHDENMEMVIDKLTSLHEELMIIMTALGAKTIEELKQAPLVILGLTREWLQERNIDTKRFANRKIT